MWVISCLVVILVSASLWLGNRIRRWYNPMCNGVLPPGSMGFPLIGETIEIIAKSHSLDIHPFFKQRLERYGPIFRTNLVGHPIVVSMDQEFNDYLLRQEGKLVEIWYFDTFSKILSMDGELRITRLGQLHKFIRGSFVTQIGVDRLKTLIQKMQLAVHASLDKWSRQPSMDLSKAISELVFEFSTTHLFGGYHFEASPEKMTEKVKTIGRGFFAFPLNVPGTTYYNSLKEYTSMLDMLKGVLKERLRAREERCLGDLLDKFIDGIGEVEFVTEDCVVQLMFVSIFAIIESVSTTMIALFKLLSENDRVVEELRAEHELKGGNVGNGESVITWEDYKSMTFTTQVINETLRLANLVPGLPRRALKDIHIKGMTIPAGWGIFLLHSTVHMNPDVFLNPLEFNPWRWKEFDSQAVSRNLMPFGGGGRQCVGAEYSRVLMFVFIHELVTNYRWNEIKGGEIYRNPSLVIKDGMHVRFSKL